MAIPKEATRLVNELIEAAAPMNVDPAGAFDKEGLFEDVLGRFRVGHPEMYRAYCAGSCAQLLRLQVGEWMRKSEDAEQHREMEGVNARARALRAIVQVPQPDGSYVAKQRWSLTLAEMDLCIEHRTGLLKAHAREIAWMKKWRKRLIQLALPATATAMDARRHVA